MIILGSGPSARNFVIPDGVKVIAPLDVFAVVVALVVTSG